MFLPDSVIKSIQMNRSKITSWLMAVIFFTRDHINLIVIFYLSRYSLLSNQNGFLTSNNCTHPIEARQHFSQSFFLLNLFSSAMQIPAKANKSCGRQKANENLFYCIILKPCCII